MNKILIIIIIILSGIIIFQYLNKPKIETIIKTETKTIIDTIIKIDTINKIITKPYIVTKTVPYLDSISNKNCDSLRTYVLNHSDSNLKFSSNLLVLGYLKNHSFNYTVYPKTTTINKEVFVTNTITNTVYKNRLFITGNLSYTNKLHLGVGLAYQRQNFLYQGSLNTNGFMFSLGYGL